MKQLKDLTIVSIEHLHPRYVLIKLQSDSVLPNIKPGQFVEIKIEGSSTTFLRRPISINFVDNENKQIWLLVQIVGDGTKALASMKESDRLNVLFPLGNGFTKATNGQRVLLVGGGVGVAPLLEYGKILKENGSEAVFLLGARTGSDLMQLDMFRKYGDVYITTEDGSIGEKGFVTQHSILQKENFTRISTCGPKPMMIAVAKFAKANNIECEVSLENMMACGLGACLCCVEKTVKGNVCVCKEGPVFNINDLTWQI
jgi:dihydroorotate dehydrogenase electron transfer subunit